MTARRVVKFVAPCVVAAALVLGACGSDSGSSSDDGGSSLGEGLSATVPETSTSTSSTTSTTTSGSTATGPFVPGAVVFQDPQGTYSIDISPAWTERSGTMTAEIEAWLIGIGTDVFSDNVNVLTQMTQGRDLQAYLDFSIQSLGELELISSQVVTGAAGNQLGLIEYAGNVAGAPVPLHALATVAVSDGVAVVATLTATEDTFPQARAEGEPYLLTLQQRAGA